MRIERYLRSQNSQYHNTKLKLQSKAKFSCALFLLQQDARKNVQHRSASRLYFFCCCKINVSVHMQWRQARNKRLCFRFSMVDRESCHGV